jgi:hypothetical protein
MIGESTIWAGRRRAISSECDGFRRVLDSRGHVDRWEAMSEERRACLGSVYRVTADFLAERGLAADVIGQMPAHLRTLVEKPPFSFGWHDYRALEEIERILYGHSPGLPEDLGRAAARAFSRTILAPVISLAGALFGATPTSIFSNLDRFFSVVIRGFAFHYEASGAKEGRVFVTISGGAVHPSLFHQIKGNLHVVYEVAPARNGRVGEPEVLRSDATGAEISLAVGWE